MLIKRNTPVNVFMLIKGNQSTHLVSAPNGEYQTNKSFFKKTKKKTKKSLKKKKKKQASEQSMP